MKTRLIVSLLLSFASLACAQSDIIPLAKKRSDNTLIVGFDSGAKTVKISATGTLEWVNGATLTGASYFRTAAGVQASSAVLDAFSGLSNAAGVLANNGSGTLSYVATSSGGNGTDDSGKIVKFDAFGQIAGGFVGTLESGPSYNFVAIGEGLSLGSETNSGTFGVPAGGGTMLVWTLPSVTGTLVSTGDTGSVTNTMLAGSIALTKLLQSSATTGQVIAWNGTAWAPTTISSGLTIGSTAISGGTSWRLLLSGTTLAELTLGSGVITALGSDVNASGGLLTYGLIGTSGTKIPLLDAANTFASGQRFGGSSGDYIALASSGTRELRLSSNAFSLGTPAWLFAMYDSGSLTDPLSSTIYFRSTASIQGNLLLYSDIYWNDGSAIIKRAAHDLWMHDPYVEATPSRWMVANSWSYPDANTYEVGVMDWITTSNVLRLGSDVGTT
ncbi:MAG: hypothetical protein WAW39_16085, partial [Prosthecobacter sp.]|uniref:hypothetical protein n=1 Tax=Prosthecobacter sp. TaxID=1965333 RepID=UPI003BB10717